MQQVYPREQQLQTTKNAPSLKTNVVQKSRTNVVENANERHGGDE